MTPGVHLATNRPALRDQLQAWTHVLPPTAVFTHLSAAELRGWWLPGPVAHPVFVTVPVGAPHPQRRGLRVSRRAAPAVAELVSGVPLAPAADVLLACARDLHLLDLVPLADSALRLGHTTREELTAAAQERRRGAPALRRALPLLDPRSESAWESVLRVLHTAVGVEVEPQHVVLDPDGRFVARGDLWLVGTHRLHEYDGEVHRDLHTHRADLARDRRLVEIGWQRCGYTAREVLRQGGAIIASADAVLGRGWDPGRLRTWRGLVAESLYGSAGRTRALARWRSNG